MCRSWGGDVVGMSTACEAVAAKHMGMEICGISCITNMAAGTGTAIYLAQKAKKEYGDPSEANTSISGKKSSSGSSVMNNYRNTERGKYDRNSKGIYYYNGNYEAFHPSKHRELPIIASWFVVWLETIKIRLMGD